MSWRDRDEAKELTWRFMPLDSRIRARSRTVRGRLYQISATQYRRVHEKVISLLTLGTMNGVVHAETLLDRLQAKMQRRKFLSSVKSMRPR
jgi:hypothetical protein